jgi:hypothetical protein
MQRRQQDGDLLAGHLQIHAGQIAGGFGLLDCLMQLSGLRLSFS